jgi:hypothetical protein
MVVKEAMKGAMTFSVAGIAFVAGMFGWAALSGIIGGVLDSVGIVIAASTYLAASPIAGFVTAGYAVQEVSA